MNARGWRGGALLGLLMTLALAAAGCGGGDEEPSGAQGTGDTPQLQDLITPGTLTVGTELPAPPFWIGDDYDSLTGGFEVVFSEPYFDANQGVLARTGTKVAGLDDAKQLQWGAQLNTNGALFISDKIQPAKEAEMFDRTVDAFDTPIVLGAVEEKQVKNAEVVGQLKTGEVYGAVVNRGSKNLEAFNTTIKAMKDDGFRDKLFQQYFAEQAAVPEIPA